MVYLRQDIIYIHLCSFPQKIYPLYFYRGYKELFLKSLVFSDAHCIYSAAASRTENRQTAVRAAIRGLEVALAGGVLVQHEDQLQGQGGLVPGPLQGG